LKKQSFGTMVAQLRKEQGMTQLDLAEKMGLLIRQYLNGKEIYLFQMLIRSPNLLKFLVSLLMN
jgi:transcriptional regulator with XRE-family HTH domain